MRWAGTGGRGGAAAAGCPEGGVASTRSPDLRMRHICWSRETSSQWGVALLRGA